MLLRCKFKHVKNELFHVFQNIILSFTYSLDLITSKFNDKLIYIIRIASLLKDDLNDVYLASQKRSFNKNLNIHSKQNDQYVLC